MWDVFCLNMECFLFNCGICFLCNHGICFLCNNGICFLFNHGICFLFNCGTCFLFIHGTCFLFNCTICFLFNRGTCFVINRAICFLFNRGTCFIFNRGMFPLADPIPSHIKQRQAAAAHQPQIPAPVSLREERLLQTASGLGVCICRLHLPAEQHGGLVCCRCGGIFNTGMIVLVLFYVHFVWGISGFSSGCLGQLYRSGRSHVWEYFVGASVWKWVEYSEWKKSWMRVLWWYKAGSLGDLLPPTFYDFHVMKIKRNLSDLKERSPMGLFQPWKEVWQ